MGSAARGSALLGAFVLLVGSVQARSSSDVVVAGKWEPIELVFDGPFATELDSDPNPFLDYRLVVTLVAPSGRVWRVPGFFDGDGEGFGAGTTWKARFSADEVGDWSYTASFRAGPGVAIDLAPGAGAPVAFDGETGTVFVGPVASDAEGFLARGRLEYAGRHHLRFREGGWFLKGGTNSPENLLGYVGFDDVIDMGGIGLVHEYLPHLQDFEALDQEVPPQGEAIVGALNYLSSVGVNSIYFLPMNLGGDGQETCPFVGYTKTPFDKTHYDVSRLHQWNRFFEHAQRKGIQLQFVLAETEVENEQWLDGGIMGPERKLFFRELVARFAHLLAVKWNLCEENDGFTINVLIKMAQYLRDLDPYDHPLAVHNPPSDFADYWALLGEPLFTATSIQYEPALAGSYVEEWRAQSAAAGVPWIVDMDENGAGLGIDNAAELRKEVLWDVYLSGGNVEWYAGYFDPAAGGGDVTLEDFRTREEMWLFMRHARDFLEPLPFWRMEPADGLLFGEAPAYGGGEVFALSGRVYAVYLPDASQGGMLDLTGTSGAFDLLWYDPRTGTWIGPPRRVAGGAVVDLGLPPADVDEDWALVARRRRTDF